MLQILCQKFKFEVDKPVCVCRTSMQFVESEEGQLEELHSKKRWLFNAEHLLHLCFGHLHNLLIFCHRQARSGSKLCRPWEGPVLTRCRFLESTGAVDVGRQVCYSLSLHGSAPGCNCGAAAGPGCRVGPSSARAPVRQGSGFGGAGGSFKQYSFAQWHPPIGRRSL